MENVQQGQWEARVLVKDKKASKTYLVNIDFVSIRPDKLRMGISLPIGTSLAAIALNGKNLDYVVIRKKLYYSGPVNSSSFNKILNIHLDPRFMLNILYDEPIKSAGWICEQDKNNFVSECLKKSENLKITWAHRKAKEKNVSIEHPDFSLEMEFHKFSPLQDTAIKNKIFTIAMPDGFHKIN